MNSAARVISNTGKYDRGLKTTLHEELHWLDVAEKIEYKLGVTVYRCLHGQAPRYLAVDSARMEFSNMAVGLFITLAWQSGTRCQMNLEI